MKHFEKIESISQMHRFREFLGEESNNKIIFSARFGTGKSTFINDFFERNKDVYQIIKILPVNYSVASNKDIFEYIKYDILLQMLEWQDIERYIIDIPYKLSAQMRFINDPFNTIVEIVKMIPKIGGKAEKAESTITGLKVLSHELNRHKETTQIDHFLKSIYERAGSIFEHDIITSIISLIIERYKEANFNKEIFLVIDDLDRIDPDHIFRIMNVLAAHSSMEEAQSNKFGFNKIVLVCDVNNIRNIFHTRYGRDTDFTGYISKFHSRTVFEFDFSKEISDAVDNIFDHIFYKDYGMPIVRYAIYERLKPVLTELIELGELNIRTLSQLPIIINPTTNRKYYVSENVIVVENNELLVNLYDILSLIFNGRNNLVQILEACRKKGFKYEIYNDNYSLYYLLADMIYLLDREHADRSNRKTRSYTFEAQELTFDYVVLAQNMGGLDIQISNIVTEHGRETELEHIKILMWDMLLQTFRYIDEIRAR